MKKYLDSIIEQAHRFIKKRERARMVRRAEEATGDKR